MIVVSDASPLINLAKIGQLDLLHKLYGDIYIPVAVWREVVLDGAGRPGAEEVETADWIKQVSVRNLQLVKALKQDLGNGEAEAISLALENNAALLLMDERLGRETARYFELRCVGLLGVFAEASQKGLITGVKLFLDELRNTAGFYISTELYEKVLQQHNESR